MKFSLIAEAISGEPKTALFPKKIVDFNRIVNKDGFWNWPLVEAKKYGGLRPVNTTGTIADLLFWLNMAAAAWDRVGNEAP